jgi:carboxyl-terminal processing protease
MNKQNNKRIAGSLAIFVVGILSSLVFIKIWDGAVSAQEGPYEGLKTFTEVLSTIQRSYVDPVKSKDLIGGAIQGMVGTLDSHSSYMPPDVYKESQIDTKGEFGGLGLQVGAKNGKIVVIAPIEGTPADRAGILAGDIIIKVDDQVLEKELGLMDAVHRMRGSKGTKVVLTIEREGHKTPLVFEMVRETIVVQSVKSKILDEEIGYVRITQFQEQTAHDLATALAKLKTANVQSLILDLRNNPGGLLNSSVEVSEQFLDDGQLVVSVKARDGKKDEYIGHGGGFWNNVPMVVLVNKGSASASEIVSGAMQDWGRAVILGAQSFGKGSVQTILPLSDGSALRLTTAKYYTPKGISIHGQGITPDILVKLERQAKLPDEEDKETQKETQAQDTSQGKTPIKKEPEKAGGTSDESDIQLQKAIDLLKTYKIFKGVNSASSFQDSKAMAGKSLVP